jgi:hypothetical protein
MLTRAYEQRDKALVTPPSRQRDHSFHHAAIAPTQVATAPATGQGQGGAAAPQPVIKKLTPADIAERRKTDQCFHCDDMFTNGHKLVCKHLFIIEVVKGDDNPQLAVATQKPTISIHALTGIHPRSGRTMQLFLSINGTKLAALLDSDSTHNFVDLEAAERAGIHLGDKAGLRVTVANDDRVQSPGCYRGMSISIDGKPFILDF